MKQFTPQHYMAFDRHRAEMDYRIGWWLSRLVVLAVLVLVAGLARAATQHTVTYTESLYKATSKVHDVAGTSEADAHAKCKAEAAAQIVAATYSCKTPVTTDVVIIVPDPLPPVGPTLQFTSTYGTAYRALQGATVSGKVNIALSDCTITGDWTFYFDGKQANVESGCPYEFLGDTTMWDSASVADGSHTFEARGSKSITATFTTSNKVAAPSPATGIATLTWGAPTQNTDGSNYLDAFGFVISYGTTPDLPLFIDVNSPGATTYVVSGLSAGTWYFCIRARNTSNVRSDCSPVVSKTL
jgi:hypothetical protein